MTPHEALSHVAGLRHETCGVHYWTFDVGQSTLRITHNTHALVRPWHVQTWPGPFLLGPHSDRFCSAREVLCNVLSVATEYELDTTRIDAALAALVEP